MTRKENLIAVRDAVVGGDIERAPFWKVWLPWNEDGHIAYLANSAARGDLNAALAFVAEVLPDAWVTIQKCGDYSHAEIETDEGEYGANNYPNPARALLIAALNALIEETDE